jgi:hypothetical protein
MIWIIIVLPAAALWFIYRVLADRQDRKRAAELQRWIQRVYGGVEGK